jgi:hypothetical protein
MVNPRNTTTLIVLWSLLPVAAMLIGLYMLNSAVWAYAIYHYVCLLPAVILGRALWQTELKRSSIKFFLVITAIALAFSGVTVLAYEFLGKYVISDQKTVELMVRMGWSKEWLWVLNIYCFTVNPFIEEIYWRGIVFKQLEKIEKPPFKHFGIIVSSFLYAFYHYFIFRLILYPVAAEILSIALAFYGAGLAILYKRTGTLWSAILAHGLLTDLAVVALIVDLMNKFPGAL